MDEKKNLLQRLFPIPRKKLSPIELEDLIRDNHIQITSVNSQFNNELRGVQEELFSIRKGMDEILLRTTIPATWLEVCQQLHAKFPEVDVPTIYKILNGYKDMQDMKKAESEYVMESIRKGREDVKTRKIKNCYRCGKAVAEGEYYKVGDKVACLSHMNEKPAPKQEPQENTIAKTVKKLQAKKGVKQNGTDEDFL